VNTPDLFVDFLVDGLYGFIWALSLARLTRLLTVDEITDFIRIWAYKRFGQDSRIGYFVTCPWCVSLWLGFATAPFLIWITETSWWAWPLYALAGSYVAGVSAVNLEGDDEIEVEIKD